MKSSPSASDEIKSAFYHPALAGFHRVAISSAKGGFIPTKADLTEKDSELYPILSLFLCNNPFVDTMNYWKRKWCIYSPPPCKASSVICAPSRNAYTNIASSARLAYSLQQSSNLSKISRCSSENVFKRSSWCRSIRAFWASLFSCICKITPLSLDYNRYSWWVAMRRSPNAYIFTSLIWKIGVARPRGSGRWPRS